MLNATMLSSYQRTSFVAVSRSKYRSQVDLCNRDIRLMKRNIAGIRDRFYELG